MRYFNIHDDKNSFIKFRNKFNWERPNLSKVWLDKALNIYDIIYLGGYYDYGYGYDEYGYYNSNKKNTTVYPFDMYFDEYIKGCSIYNNSNISYDCLFYASNQTLYWNYTDIPGIMLSYDGYIYEDIVPQSVTSGTTTFTAFPISIPSDTTIFIKASPYSRIPNWSVGRNVSFVLECVGDYSHYPNQNIQMNVASLHKALLLGDINLEFTNSPYYSSGFYFNYTTNYWRNGTANIDYLNISISRSA